MVYSRGVFYFRRVVFIYTLMLLFILIFLQLFWYSNKCRRGAGNEVFRHSSVAGPSLIVISGEGFLYSRRFQGGGGVFLQSFYLYVSHKNHYFGNHSSILHLLYSIWFDLDNFASLKPRFTQSSAILSAYYNSINGVFSVTHTSRLISQLRCNIRLINHAKYDFSPDSGSVFRLITPFSRSQEEGNEYIHSLFDSYLSADQSALASGTLIGSQSTISTSLKDELIQSGTVHVVVASGYNLVIVVGWVQSILSRFLSKRKVTVLSLVSIWWYVFLALYNASVVRAAWMCSLSLFAIMVGRPKSVWRTMTMSILLLLFFQPILVGSISFQLSVLSTIGVLLINQTPTQKEDDGLTAKHEGWGATLIAILKENCWTTIGANLLTLPIIIFWFKRVSLIAVVSNTLLLWLIPLLMYCSTMFIVAVHIHPYLGYLAAFPIRIISNAFLTGVHFFAHVPYASVEVQYISFSEMVLLYVCIFGFFYFRHRFHRLKKRRSEH